jgi:hypothetical protein
LLNLLISYWFFSLNRTVTHFAFTERNRESSYFTNVSSSTDENAQKLNETYLLKLNALESQVCKDILIFVIFLMF